MVRLTKVELKRAEEAFQSSLGERIATKSGVQIKT